MALLAIDNVGVSYGKAEAVRNVSLAVEKGRIVTVIGPNGAGKTSLLAAAIGLIPSTGRILYDGDDISRLDTEARVERGFCLVPEKRELFAEMSVYDNLRLGAFTSRRDRRHPPQHGRGVRPLPAPARAPRAERRHAVRRRAPDAGARPRADG